MSVTPRIVVVTRSTDYALLLARHGTRGQAEFFLRNRGQNMETVAARHDRFMHALAQVHGEIPNQWRSARLDRRDLDRFVFEPQDLVVVLGQDGLVANLAKYLSGQIVIGLNPMPDLYEGVLVQYRPQDIRELAQAALSAQAHIEARAMAEATLDDGQSLLCLNEIFVGHASHQSARYLLEYAGDSEQQSSSGVIVTTGTGASGWARSIHTANRSRLQLPTPSEHRLSFFVREAWPSIATGAAMTEGDIDIDHALRITSEMDDNGVIFGDGIETDHLTFGYGQRLQLRPAQQTLNMLAA